MKRILLVEDDPTTQKLISESLSGQFEVVACANSAVGLETFEGAASGGSPFDCLILDIFLPDDDGLDLLAKIRFSESENGVAVPVKVVMCTGSDAKEDRLEAQTSSVDAYIVKPVDTKLLNQTLSQLLEEASEEV